MKIQSKLSKFQRVYFFVLGFLFCSSLFYVVFTYSFTTNDEENKSKENTDEITEAEKTLAPYFPVPKVPDELFFAGEKVPLDNFEIFERVDRELVVNMYWHSATLLMFKRANRWFPVIEPILKSNGIPDDFKYVALIESGLMNVISPAGATGYWQFMESAAKEFGLEVNKEVDERYNVELSTAAACRYIKRAYSIFGNWTLTAASYNMGMAGIQRHLSNQKVNNYYNLHLNEETSRYIARVLAVKEVFSDPERFGFHFTEEDLYKPLEWREIVVNDGIDDLIQFSIDNGSNYRMLKYFNPWLRDTKLTNKSKKTYSVKLP